MDIERKQDIRICLLIGLSFLWTGCGYLSWLYHLSEYYDPSSTDMLSEVIGYLFQAAGLLAYILYSRGHADRDRSRYSYALISLTGLVLNMLAALSPSGILSLIFGYGMNTVFGMIAGLYLTFLAEHGSPSSCGIIFGAGYGAGSILSYIISLAEKGSFLQDPKVFILYAVIFIITVPLSVSLSDTDSPIRHPSPQSAGTASMLWLPGITILLLSCVKSGGFYFPVEDLGNNISLELSRAFYAAGLIAAGLINDRKRSAGAVLCMAALVFPFFTIIAGSNPDLSHLVWVLSYIFFGFYAVYRVLLFIDLSRSRSGLEYAACMGLMWGRIGDASGAASGIMLSAKPMLHITLMAILFVICVFLFFRLYQTMYMQPAQPEPDYVQMMASRYDLSGRETDILRLILDGKTNKEISDKLYISDNTVKFHVRNLLRKTGCSRRKELLALHESIRNE